MSYLERPGRGLTDDPDTDDLNTDDQDTDDLDTDDEEDDDDLASTSARVTVDPEWSSDSSSLAPPHLTEHGS